MEPIYTINDDMIKSVAEIVKKESDLNHTAVKQDLNLRRVSRMHSVSASVRIEQNTLSDSEILDCINGKTVVGPENDIKAVKNAWKAYELLDYLDAFSLDDLKKAHGIMMEGLTGEAGMFRRGNVGVADSEGNLLHMGAMPYLVPSLISELLSWVRKSDLPMLVKSAIFHVEFEMIHPFADGNGRMGRLWHSLLLDSYDNIYSMVPIENLILKHQDDYYHVLNRASITGDSTEFIMFMLDIINEALTDILSKSPAPLVPTKWELISAYLDGHDYISNKDVCNVLNVSSATATRVLKKFDDEGKLLRIKVGKLTAYIRR